MSASDQTSDILSDYLRLLRRSPAAPEIAASFLSADLTARDATRPCALLLSPHPDDECLTGALPLRLRREENWRIINIAVTLGSKQERREARKSELAKACAVLGFDCVLPEQDGFSDVVPTTRAEHAPAWQKMVARLAGIITHYQPQAIFMPHAQDAHVTHIGTHQLAIDALAKQNDDFTCAVVQTEYWQPHAEPNLLVGIKQEDAAHLMSALACHVGEVARNPYDARFPAYLIDNVRRGSERVGGKGVPAASMDFSMLYKYGLWRNGKFIPSLLNRIVGTDQPVGALFD